MATFETNVFFYDATFEGLLSAVFDAYTQKVFPHVLLTVGAVPPLFTTHTHTVITQKEKVDRVFTALSNKLSAKGMHDVMHAWLAENQGSGMLIFHYICKVFDSKRSIENDMGDDVVLGITKLAKQVAAEAHLMCGFVRFQKTIQDIYFAVIGPRYNVLALILPHFSDRFADQKWIIYDEKRGYGFLFDSGNLQEISMDAELLKNGKLSSSLLAEDELAMQNSWKDYCKAITIKERINPTLQKRCMPKRFWKYLTEQQT